MQRITGPFKGCFIAARSFRIGEVWMGEARVFPARPLDFEDTGSIVKLGGDWINTPSELDAVQNAETMARGRIEQMPVR